MYFRDQNARSFSMTHAFWRALVQGLLWKIRPKTWRMEHFLFFFCSNFLTFEHWGTMEGGERQGKGREEGIGKNILECSMHGQKRRNVKDFRWYIRAALPLAPLTLSLISLQIQVFSLIRIMKMYWWYRWVLIQLKYQFYNENLELNLPIQILHSCG